jgi:ribosomal protein S18 acetylase RimI-like enzyme
MMPTGSLHFDLIPASTFSYEELTEAYNHTRVDYIVPMPMNASKLREYVELYDVDLAASVVAVDGNEILGLAMLGVREGRGWITRLGVIRNNRRQGTGSGLFNHLLAQAQERDLTYLVIEVIADNLPAYNLFKSRGFTVTRDLLVLRRPPRPVPPLDPTHHLEALDQAEALALLRQRRSKPSWIDEYESLAHAGNLRALLATLPDGSRGWLVYQTSPFQLGRLVIQTEAGDPLGLARTLLPALHRRYPHQDTKTENLPATDPHWPAFAESGYLVVFRRNEMVRYLK